jgi:hypothetical protein
MFKNLTYGWIVCFLGATIAGCGDGLRRVTIEGVVTAQQSPLADATVQFFPKGSTVGEGAIGTTDSNGKFTVTSSRDDAAGIPPGTYTVRVSRMMDRDGKLLPPDATQADYPDAIEAVPPPYSTATSPIEVTITDQGGNITVEIPVKLLGPKKK